MITIKNIQTGEFVNVSSLRQVDNVICAYYDFAEPSAKWLAKFPCVTRSESTVADSKHTDVQCRVFTISEGWELVTKERKPRAPKAAPKASKKAAKKAEPAPEINPAVDEEVEVIKVEEVTEPAVEVVAEAAEDTKKVKTMDEYEAEIAATYGSMGVGIFRKAVEYIAANYTAAMDEAAVRRIAEAMFNEYAEAHPAEMKAAKKAVKKATKKADEVHCAKYDRILAKVSRGRRVYLHGPAGSGKSHTAEQIAADLGLPFFGQTTIQFAHDVRGYGDASGSFVDTPFFKAFADEEHGGTGGLYFQDEYDRSNAEAAIVLNSALANGWYDFPVIGRVTMNPNFRFMAAGNTLMKGADDGYITGQEIDPSSRDRFDFYFEVGYLREVELHIAHGNTEIVDFVEDVRQAIKACGIEHVVSYRATAAMTDEVENENDLVACCEEGVFKGLDVDARREIYAALQNKDSRWAKALKKTL